MLCPRGLWSASQAIANAATLRTIVASQAIGTAAAPGPERRPRRHRLDGTG